MVVSDFPAAFLIYPICVPSLKETQWVLFKQYHLQTYDLFVFMQLNPNCSAIEKSHLGLVIPKLSISFSFLEDLFQLFGRSLSTTVRFLKAKKSTQKDQKSEVLDPASMLVVRKIENVAVGAGSKPRLLEPFFAMKKPMVLLLLKGNHCLFADVFVWHFLGQNQK